MKEPRDGGNRPGPWTIPWKGTDVPYRNAETTRCTALGSKGGFCDSESLPDAPFPICLTHAARLMKYLRDVMPGSLDDRMIVAAETMRQDREAEAERRRRSPRTEVVYYVQVGQTIKIGYTGNLAQRMRSYPPSSRLLAYEPGGLAIEAQRHAQFAEDLTAGREWFAPSDQLLAHIASIKAARAA